MSDGNSRLAEGNQHESPYALTVLVRSLRYEIYQRKEEASMRVLLSRTTTGFVLAVALCLALSPAVLYTNGDGPGGERPRSGSRRSAVSRASASSRISGSTRRKRTADTRV